MLKYSFYDCPCQNSCWKDFCNTKTFILHMEIQMLTLIFAWQRSLQTFSLLISEVAPLSLGLKDPVSGSISIDSFLLNSSANPKGIISLDQYTIL